MAAPPTRIHRDETALLIRYCRALRTAAEAASATVPLEVPETPALEPSAQASLDRFGEAIENIFAWLDLYDPEGLVR